MSERELRLSSRVRGVLIGYGVAAFTWIFARQLPSPSSDDSLFGGALSSMAVGLLIQLVLIVARHLIKRHDREHGTKGEIYPQAMHVLELLADAMTVLLFAVGTFQAIFASMPDAL